MINSKLIYKGDFTKQNIKLEFVKGKHSFRPEFEARLPKLWEDFINEAKGKGLNPWDGSYCRITNPDEFTRTWIVKLSNVNYSRIRALVILREEAELEPSEYINHISTGAVIETNDGYFVMGKRGATMSKADVDFIGGGLQDDEIEVKEFSDFEKNVRKEMAEEANIDPEIIDSLGGIGILFSATTNFLFFYKVKLNINSEKLRELFKDRAEDEMSDLLFFTSSEYKNYLKSLTSYRPLVADLLN